VSTGSFSPQSARDVARLDPEHQLLTLVFNSARDMMLLARVEPGELFRVVSVNRTYLETIRAAGYDFDAEDFPGRTYAETVAMFGFSAESVAVNRARYEQVLATRKPLEYEEVTHAPAGLCYGQSTITPILDAAGECAFLLYSSQNVTERRRTDEALQENRRLLATLLDNLPGMAYRCRNDPQWTMEFVSEGCRQLTGCAPEDLVGNRRIAFGDLVLEADRPGVWEEVQAALRGRRPFEIVYRLRRTDGAIAWMWERGQGVFAGGSEPVAIEGFITDITARKQMEEALAESEEKFAKAFRASPDAISLSDLATGRFLDVNEGYERLSGFTRAELVGRTSAEMGFWADPGDRERILAALARDGAIRDMQVQARNRAGELFSFLLSAEKVEIAGRACLVVVSRDVTARLKAERYLRESEEKFAKAFRSSPSPLTITEIATGRYIEVNEGFERVTGYRREDVVGRTSLEVGIWENAADRDEMIRLLTAGREVRNVEFRFKRRDGQPLVMRCSFEHVDLAGAACLLTVLEDITDQRRAEQALRESEERVASAFRATPDAMAIADLETNLYLEVNEGFERLFGYTRAEVIGRSALELKLLADPSSSELVKQRILAGEKVRDLEMSVLTKHGERRTILHSVERIQVGGRECLLRVSRDITERKRTEEVLRQSEEKFAIAFRSSPIPLTIVELETGRFIEVNDSFEKTTGYARAETIGRTTLDLGLWPVAADREAFAERLAREGVVRNLIVTFRLRDGGDLLTRCNSELIELGGKRCILTLAEDISEEQRAEEERALLEAQLRQSQKLEALGTLAGGIAHDFNNILTAIVVNQELALMDLEQPAELRERLGEISRASNRAKDLVRQILAFSRQQSEQVRTHQRLMPVVQEAMALVRASLPATIEIDQALDADAPAVLADATQVHQIVMNLCTNAAHAMRDRPGRLTVRLAARTLDETQARTLPGLHAGAYARLTISDTGHGMARSVLARIFEPFFTTKGPGEGTGLGLAVVHGIMKDHGGGIFVDSTPEVGTQFDLYFPAATGSGEAAVAAQENIVFGHGESVLVVDDEPAVCDAVGSMLRKLNYRVETFTEPERALARFRADPAAFNLLLTDRTMPRLTGPQLIGRVEAVRSDLAVLVMSGLSSGPGGDPVVRHRVLAKPLDIVELSRAVRDALAPASS
jgi:PAS domain S-box-containing protein